MPTAPSRCFSDRYARLIEAAGATRDPAARRGYHVGPDGSTISERLLQCIWFDQLVDPGALRTSDGRPVQVLAPGFWNLEAGPDFHHAELRLGDGPPVRGAVEVHFRPEEWAAHGHGGDSRYDATILHVVFQNPRGLKHVRTAAGRAVPHLPLADALTEGLETLRARLDTEDYPYASSANLGQCYQDGLTGTDAYWNLVALAGEARLLLKARRAATLADDWDQVCYSMLGQALGYKAFAAPCRELAERAPYAVLRVIAGDARSDRPRAVEAALLGMAGLLPSTIPDDLAPEAVEYLEAALRYWQAARGRFTATPMPAHVWRAPQVRPANRPARRLVALARLLAATCETGLARALRNHLIAADSPRAAWGDLERFLAVDADPFWAYRASATGRPWPRPQRLVGPGRARVLAIDAVVPAMLAWARATADAPFESRLLVVTSAAPAQGMNAKLRLALYRMGGAPTAWPRQARTALHGQGLLHLLQEWCVERPTCDGCAVRQVLANGPPAHQIKRAEAPYEFPSR